jgi:Putative  PD-(D/E)XK family member, (DUF4420)
VTDDLRKIVAEHWDALTAAAGPEWLTSDLPVEVAGLPVKCAVDAEGSWHLLVPVTDRDDVQPDTRAAAVHLVPRTLQDRAEPIRYADLALLRPDLREIFTGLCTDVVGALALGPADALSAVREVLNGWHELLRSGPALGPEQLAGLFGELTILNLLLDRSPDAVTMWTGPLLTHDFSRGGLAVEVKSTISRDGRVVRINGIDQLSPPPGGELVLWWLRFDTSSSSGTSVPEIVASTAVRVGDAATLFRLLARVGYHLADAGRYGGVRFTQVEQAAYSVTGDFPRIVPASIPGGIPPGIRDLVYTVDLEATPAPVPLSTVESSEFLQMMAER